MTVKCKLCDKDYVRIQHKHLKLHGYTFQRYRKDFPDAITCASEASVKARIREIRKNAKPVIKHMVECQICSKTMTKISGTHLMIHDIDIKEYKRRFPAIPTYNVTVQTAANKKVRGNEQSHAQCQICGVRLRRVTYNHINTHGATIEEYKERFPDSPLMSQDSSKNYSAATIRRYEDPEQRRKTGEKSFLHYQNPEARELTRLKGIQARERDPTINIRIGETIRNRYKNNPEFRQKMVDISIERNNMVALKKFIANGGMYNKNLDKILANVFGESSEEFTELELQIEKVFKGK